jgi:hypothetical protein
MKEKILNAIKENKHFYINGNDNIIKSIVDYISSNNKNRRLLHYYNIQNLKEQFYTIFGLKNSEYLVIVSTTEEYLPKPFFINQNFFCIKSKSLNKKS